MKRRGKGKGGASKRKGSSFERKVCEQLSRFVAPDSKDAIFWRSSMSGGRATIQNRKGGNNRSQLGDISSIDKRGALIAETFVIECKHYKDLAIPAFFLKGSGKLYGFWKTLKKLCLKTKGNDKLKPLLIAKQNSMPTMLITTVGGFTALEAMGATEHVSQKIKILLKGKFDIIVMPFEETFK